MRYPNPIELMTIFGLLVSMNLILVIIIIDVYHKLKGMIRKK